MRILVTKEDVLKAIQDRLQKRMKAWQLVEIYNGLAEATVMYVNDETGEIECDDEDASDIEIGV